MDWKGLIGTFFTRVCNLSTLCFSHYYSIVTGVLPCLSSTAHGPNKCVLVSDIKITADLTSFGVWGLLELGNVLHQPWAVDSWQWMDDYEGVIPPRQEAGWEVYFINVLMALSDNTRIHAVKCTYTLHSRGITSRSKDMLHIHSWNITKKPYTQWKLKAHNTHTLTVHSRLGHSTLWILLFGDRFNICCTIHTYRRVLGRIVVSRLAARMKFFECILHSTVQGAPSLAAEQHHR